MVDLATTPDPNVADDALDTPADEAEPAEELAPDEQADQSPATGSPIAQAEYTRATQLSSAIRRELGLPKGATQAQVIEALRAARAEPTGDEDEDEVDEDPRLIAERQRRFEAEIRVTNAVYGEQFTVDAIDLFNAIRTTDDLDELVTMLAAFRDSHPGQDVGAAVAAGAAAAAEEATDTGTPAEPAIGLSEGDSPPASQSTPVRGRESGPQTAVRGIFESLGIGSRPRS